MRRSPKATSLIHSILLLLLVLSPVAAISVRSMAAQTGPGFVRAVPGQSRFLRPDGQPFFVWAANYEGPIDRAWRMWEDGKFDPALIQADLMRARTIGINTIRIFIQPALRDDILANNFRKLDLVVDMARRSGLYLIITFTDYVDPNISSVVEVQRRVAEHYVNEQVILAYDLRNEPQFDLLSLSIYPTAPVALQTDRLIGQYGERIKLTDIPTFRQSTEGRTLIPSRLSDEQSYIYVNNYRLYREFLDEGAAWVSARPGLTTLDYIDSPDSARWHPLLGVMDDTLRRWIGVQADAIRDIDPNHMITLAYSNIVLAKLSSNNLLSFQSPHRFVPTGAINLQRSIAVLENLRKTFPTQPFMLEEFGYSNEAAWERGAQPVDEQVTASLETAVWLYLYANGWAGGGKWMLNNFPTGENASQNAFGFYDDNSNPKISAYVLSALQPYLASEPQPGIFSDMGADGGGGVKFTYRGPGALLASGSTSPAADVVQFASGSANPIQTFVTWQNDSEGRLDVWTSGPTDISVSLPATLGDWAINSQATLRYREPNGGWTDTTFRIIGDRLVFKADGLRSYRLTAAAPAIGAATPKLGATFFPETQHNLQGKFLEYWQKHGGLPIYGYPLTEEFMENGYLVQYFERNRFELHPEYAGTPYEVLLGRLGATQTENKLFPISPAFSSEANHIYFPETGHSLAFAFLGYWNDKGGLAQFGYPISEEIPEVSPTDGKVYTVQYFERARFEYHPEYAGTPNEVLLGLLGVTELRNKGWVK